MPIQPTSGMGFIRYSGGAMILTAPGTSGGLDPETIVWRDRATSAGGGFLGDSIDIADALIIAIKESSFDQKIIYLLPFPGSNLATARVPLRDKLGMGISGSTAFVNGDFSQVTGLQGNGSTKYLSPGIKPSQLGISNNGGLGWWENNISFGGNVEPMGCYGILAVGADERFLLDLRNTAQSFAWGTTGNRALVASAASNGHYYGQRSSQTLRVLYKSGSQIASSVVLDAATEAQDNALLICGSYADTLGPFPWPGRGACAYLTDGTMTLAEIGAFHSLLRNKLITPTGRPS